MICDMLLARTYFKAILDLLVIANQIGTLTHGPSFGHNLCFKYLNGSYEPILHIYVFRAFQSYNELFNPMSFDL
jgi:hypothetical protein